MKTIIRLRLAAVLIVLVPLLAWGSTRTKTVTLTYNANDFTLVQSGGKTHITSSVHEISCISDSVAPALPKFTVDVLVAPNEELVSFSKTLTNSTYWTSVDIAPCEIPVTTDALYTGQYPDVTFTGTYPADVQCDSMQSIDGYRFVRFVVSPFAYQGSTQRLYVAQTVNIQVNLSSPGSSGAPSVGMPAAQGIMMRDLVSDMCINGDEMNTLYADVSLPDTDNGEEPYRYLLIVKNGIMRNKFKPLAEWKTRKGVRAKILTMDEINSTFTTNMQQDTMQAKIKAAIKYYFDRGLQYVLLGGDENDVPVKREHLEYKSDSIYHYVASDLYYATVKEGEKCRNAASQVYHPNDSVAFSSDLVVTRYPALSPDNALIFSKMIVDYESSPDTTDWQDNMLMTGVKISYDTLMFGTIISDVHERSYMMDSVSIYPYWPNGTITRFFDTGTDMPGGASYDVTTNRMVQEFNKGYTLVHMDTHGTSQIICLENEEFERTRARAIYNSGHTVMALTSCSTNAFDLEQTCVSENFMNSRNAKILGYFACSREGWSRSSFNLNSLFFEKLLKNPEHGFGRAATAAKNEFFKKNVLMNNWLMIAVNPLGDPEMPVFISKPKKLTAPRYAFSSGTLYVTNLVDSCNICVMSEADFGDTYYAVHRNVQGASVFHNVPTNSSICITKPGYIPVVTNLQQLSVVQNTTIAENMLIVGDSVVVGEAVTNEIPHGPVIVESGTTTIVAPNGVKLYPGTYVRKGAELKIQTK